MDEYFFKIIYRSRSFVTRKRADTINDAFLILKNMHPKAGIFAITKQEHDELIYHANKSKRDPTHTNNGALIDRKKLSSGDFE